MSEPSVAVVVCTLNRADHVIRALGDVIDQAPVDAEIVVVDQSAPEHRNKIERWAVGKRVRLIFAAPGLPQARNLAVESTSAPLIVFFDDDVALDPGCLRAHISALQGEGIGAVVGRIREAVERSNSAVVRNDLGVGGRIRVNLDGPAAGPIAMVKGANMSFHRQALEAAGGFDAGFGGTAFLEEADVSLRVAAAGYRIWFAPQASLTHFSAPSGGVRMTRDEAEWWRFHNTARLLRRHRGRRSAIAMSAVFCAIAIKKAVTWRQPAVIPSLLGALAKGWMSN